MIGDEPVKTRTIFYINVGNLPKAKAEQYVRELRDRFLTEAKQIPGDQVLHLPIRDGESRVEVFHYDD